MFWKKKVQEEEEFVWKDFREKSYEELEREVDAAYGEAVKQRNIKLAILGVILIFIFQDIIGFWLNFGLPRVAKYKTQEVIDVVAEPIHTELEEEEYKEIFDYVTLEDKDVVKLRKQAEISVSGLVVAKNYLFIGNYLPKGKRVFQSTALMDLGVVWGDFTKEEILKNYAFYSAKDVKHRTMYPRLKMGITNPPIPWDYAKLHMTNIHAIPANKDIMSAMIYLGKNKPVKVEGLLVDVQLDSGAWRHTSTDREVAAMRCRDNSPSEIIYVTRLQIGDKVYE